MNREEMHEALDAFVNAMEARHGPARPELPQYGRGEPVKVGGYWADASITQDDNHATIVLQIRFPSARTAEIALDFIKQRLAQEE